MNARQCGEAALRRQRSDEMNQSLRAMRQGTLTHSTTAAICAFALIAGWAGAQQHATGKITGTVRDHTGVGISAVELRLARQGSVGPPVALTRTRADGTYSFEHVEDGNYTLAAELDGFQRATRRIVLSPDRVSMVNLTLAPLGQTSAPASSKRSQGLDQVGYHDESRLKPGEFAGSIDPGGYSTPGQAVNRSRLLEGAVDLKNGMSPASAAHPSVPPSASDASLAQIETQLKKTVEADPKSFEANHNLGEFYIHSGKLTAAIPYMETAYRLDPSHYVNAYDLALAYLETRNYTAARRQVRSVLARQNTAELHNLLGEVEERSGDPVAAVNEYERAAHMEPSEKNIFDWGVELLLHQTLEPAMQVFQNGVARYPQSTKLWIGWGVAHYSRGRYEEAVNAFLRASDLEPSDVRPYLFLGQMYNVSTAHAEAVTERLRRFVELQPNNPQALYNYALSLWKGKRSENASADLNQVESLLRRAATLNPRLAEPHLQLGIMYSEQHEYRKAIGQYEEAIELEGNHAEAHYRLAQACVRAGEKERAKAEFNVYEQLHKEQVAKEDRQRAEIQQFVYTMKENPAP